MSEVNPAPTAEPTLALYPEPGAPEPEKTPDVPEASQDAVQADTPDPAPETGKEPEAQAAAPDGAEPEQSGEEDEGEVVSTFAELMEAKELDPEWVDTLTVPVKVNGEAGEVTIKDLVSSYRMNQAAEERLEKVKAQAKQANEEIAAKTEEFNRNLGVAAKLMTKAEQAITIEEESIEGLREDDPAEYAARKADFADRRKALDDAKREAGEEINRDVEQRVQEQQQLQQQILQEESESLLKALPDWQDSEKAKVEKSKIAEYLVSQGFTQEEVSAAADHRYILVARKAMLHDAMSNNAPRKKVVKPLKVLKPGGKPETTQKPAETDRATLLYG